ncbi:50S ribosomal protein L25/general stress protein Ctc [Ancrocorticia populi]|uniref:Large ribosomal subunit protein bL25 n=1 Tax=Ancrocorticia populi TaxID=2175228 RepID=A0A2V1KC37_9ACTO|nr:50S ribosomal protein L25/general stress protein Ctc [Ancrocorticia populi]PWF27271.1 50S ribosomal protein L25 [Ancrocorticia populi]
MAERTKLIAEARNSFGKGSSRQLRRAGRVPAVAYGHGTDPVHMSVDAHELFLAIKGQANALLDVELDGEKMLVLVKDIQRHPISRDYLHADLLRVKRGEKVQVEVPVEVIGEPAPGTIHTVEYMALPILAPATDIPDYITVDVTGRADGEHITVGDIDFPAGVECELESDTIVVVVTTPEVDLELEAADEAAAEAASAASDAEAKEDAE